MKRVRAIYAMFLAVIYVTATSLSSISILACDHQHHQHHHYHYAAHSVVAEHNCSACGCGINMVAIADDCCDHHHPVLGDNHTDFVVNDERDNSRIITALSLLATPAIVAEVCGNVDIYDPSFSPIIYGDEVAPLRVATLGTEALRAPPTLA